MSRTHLAAATIGVAAAAMLLTAVHGAEKPNYGFWTAAQMGDLDKKLLSSLDATKGSSVDMMGTEHSFFMVTHRESSAPSGEVHKKYGDFAVVRSGEGGILAGGILVHAKQSAPNEMRGKIQGGTLHRLKAGDAYYVPANVPHQTIVEPGHYFRVEMLKVECRDGYVDLPEFMSWDAALLTSTEKKLKTKLNSTFQATQDFIKNDNTQFHMNHKEGSAESEIHAHLAEFQIIRNGQGTMMLGGKVVNPKNTGPGEIRGTALEGAVGQPLRVGDLLYIPAGMPHHTIVDRTQSQDKLIVKVWVP